MKRGLAVFVEQTLHYSFTSPPTGCGIIYIHLDSGSIEIEVDSYMGLIEINNYCYISDIVDGQFHYYYYLDDERVSRQFNNI